MAFGNFLEKSNAAKAREGEDLIKVKRPVGPGRDQDGNAINDVKKVRLGLIGSGFLEPHPRNENNDVYDEEAQSAVKSFQKINKLKVDGLLNPGGPTLNTLNKALTPAPRRRAASNLNALPGDAFAENARLVRALTRNYGQGTVPKHIAEAVKENWSGQADDEVDDLFGQLAKESPMDAMRLFKASNDQLKTMGQAPFSLADLPEMTRLVFADPAPLAENDNNPESDAPSDGPGDTPVDRPDNPDGSDDDTPDGPTEEPDEPSAPDEKPSDPSKPSKPDEPKEDPCQSIKDALDQIKEEHRVIIAEKRELQSALENAKAELEILENTSARDHFDESDLEEFKDTGILGRLGYKIINGRYKKTLDGNLKPHLGEAKKRLLIQAIKEEIQPLIKKLEENKRKEESIDTIWNELTQRLETCRSQN